MENKCDLPELPANKGNPEYLGQLEEGYKSLAEILNEDKKEATEFFKKFKDEFGEKSSRILLDRTILRDDGKGNIISQEFDKIIEINPEEVNEIRQQLADKYEKFIDKKAAYTKRIKERSRQFLEAILDLTEIRDIVEESGNLIGILYTAQGNGDRVVQSLLDFENGVGIRVEKQVRGRRYKHFNEPLRVERIKRESAGKNIYLAYNPSDVIDLEKVMMHAGNMLFARFSIKNPGVMKTDASIIERLVSSFTSRPSSGINAGHSSGTDCGTNAVEIRTSSEEKYRNECQVCSKKDGCPAYYIGRILYDKK